MVFGLFKRKDPICGMKEEKGKGIDDRQTGKWFCSSSCMESYQKAVKQEKKAEAHGVCCH